MFERIRLYHYGSEEENNIFFQEICETLSQPIKSLPGKYAYGGGGTELWFEMLQDPYYYQFQCEKSILLKNWRGILENFGTPEFNLVDLGAGDGKKVKILLEGAIEMGLKPSYIGVDICEESNDVLAEEMGNLKGKIDITILTSTNKDAAEWITKNTKGVNVYCILGSTIGNFSKKELQKDFSEITQYMKDGEFFLIGADLVKDPAVILKSYSQPNYPIKGSPQGILNIYERLGGSLHPNCFYPYLIYDPYERIVKDMMVSKRNQVLKVRDREFQLEENEPILVFFSRKFTIESLSADLIEFGLNLVAHFKDERDYYAITIYRHSK